MNSRRTTAVDGVLFARFSRDAPPRRLAGMASGHGGAECAPVSREVCDAVELEKHVEPFPGLFFTSKSYIVTERTAIKVHLRQDGVLIRNNRIRADVPCVLTHRYFVFGKPLEARRGFPKNKTGKKRIFPAKVDSDILL